MEYFQKIIETLITISVTWQKLCHMQTEALQTLVFTHLCNEDSWSLSVVIKDDPLTLPCLTPSLPHKHQGEVRPNKGSRWWPKLTYLTENVKKPMTLIPWESSQLSDTRLSKASVSEPLDLKSTVPSLVPWYGPSSDANPGWYLIQVPCCHH